ncbi:uncharacterized protein LOC141613735 [Silene latifolia]|uniref:uncharacterized protein LOC141613735 n=1 Tax=Silene latifolia TaxID=37657 RepID=UPI003D787B37
MARTRGRIARLRTKLSTSQAKLLNDTLLDGNGDDLADIVHTPARVVETVNDRIGSAIATVRAYSKFAKFSSPPSTMIVSVNPNSLVSSPIPNSKATIPNSVTSIPVTVNPVHYLASTVVKKPVKAGMSLFYCHDSAAADAVEITSSIALPVVQYYKKGLFAFRFDSHEAMINVLRQGPWKIGPNSLILKHRTPSFSMEMEKVAKVLVWILFPGLDPYLWSESVLSKIASKLGKPLFADLATTNKEKLSFARVMVEIDVTQPFLDHVDIMSPFLGPTSQKVVYEWVPFYYSGCGKLGHKFDTCKWVKQSKDPKPVEPTITPSERGELGQRSLSDSPPSVASPPHPSVSLVITPDPTSGLNIEGHAVVDSVISNPFQPLKPGEISPETDSIVLLDTNELSDLGPIQGGKDTLIENVGSGCSELGQRSLSESSKPPDIGINIHSVCSDTGQQGPSSMVFLNPSSISITHTSKDAQFIHLQLHHFASNLDFHLSLVYGSNNASERESLWEGLLKSSTTDPWLVLGVNIVRDPTEKLSSTPPLLHEMLAFNNCLSSCHLDDLVSTGCDLTWTNKQEPNTRVWSKLDRALVNPASLATFPNSFADFPEPAKEDLLHCQAQLVKDPFSASLIMEEKTLLQKFTSLKTAELKCLSQRAKIKHIQYADCSSKYFFAKLFQRRNQQQIGIIKDINGDSCTGRKDISLPFQTYYQELLGKCRQVKALDPNLFLHSPTLSSSVGILLTSPLTLKEIKDVVFSLDSNSSPGIDGFSAGFFKSTWAIIGMDLSMAVLSFFKKHHMAKQAKSTLISLIPKKQALVQGYDRKNISPRCHVKLDIRKAFDSLNLDFLAYSMNLMGFPQLFTDWSGLRQWDPLSPYLFVLGMEVLSKYLRKLCQQPHVSHHPKCHALNLTHLFFADDLMIFTHGDSPSVAAVSDALNDFAQVSGLFANPEKNNVYFGGVPPSLQDLILTTTRFSKGSFPFRYLGFPLNTVRLSSAMFDPLIIVVQRAVTHWSALLLSYVGNVQLLNSVVFGLTTFWCSSVFLPRHITKKISKIGKDFFWGIPSGEHRWVYLLAQNHSGIWAHWIQHYIFKESDIWHIQSKPYFPYSFKAILTVRDTLSSRAGSIFNAQTLLHSWSSAGKLSLHNAYLFLKNAPAAGPWTNSLTHSRIAPSHKIICSLAVQNQLATIDNLQRRGICYINRCVLCENNWETCDHLFFHCPLSRAVWQDLLHWMGILRQGKALMEELLYRSSYGVKHWRHVWFMVSLVAAVHQLWAERNRRIFQGTRQHCRGLVQKIKFLVSVRMFLWHSHDYKRIVDRLCS